MKIVNISTDNEANVNGYPAIFGLGDDGMMYFWLPENGEWRKYTSEELSKKNI